MNTNNTAAIPAEPEREKFELPEPRAWQFKMRYGSGLQFRKPDDVEDSDTGEIEKPTPLFTDDQLRAAYASGQSEGRRHIGKAQEELADYEAAMADARRQIRALDVLLNGGDGSSAGGLSDIVAQVAELKQAEGRRHIADGRQLVPVEPTPEMRNAPFAGRLEDQCMTSQMRRRDEVARVYRAMLSAAPKETAPEAGQ
jgi:hypothetical protein